MKMRRWWLILLNAWVVSVAFSLMAFPAFAADDASLDRLEAIIKQQQAQIDAQQKALEALQDQVETMKIRDTTSMGKQTAMDEEEAIAADAKMEADASIEADMGADEGEDENDAADSTIADYEGDEVADSPTSVEFGRPKGHIKIYGQVNKAVLYSDDGNEGNFYLVDNDNWSTRMGILGFISPYDRYEVGTRVEFEWQTNPSDQVSQKDPRVDDTELNKRHLDLWVDTPSFGMFRLGWGSTASDTTSEVDLSGTSGIGYSDIGGMAGGQLFYNKSEQALSDTPIRDVYSNMDGLGRDERIRYDSPSLAGLSLAASYINDGGGDIALFYSAEFESLVLAAAAAYADPAGTSDNIDDQINGSVSALHNSGINLTFATGVRNHKDEVRDDGSFFYTKLGYRADWCPFGVTSMTAEYGLYKDIQVNDDDAQVYGLQMVQNFEEWGTDAYIGYRFHKLDRNGADFDNINAIMTGMRVLF